MILYLRQNFLCKEFLHGLGRDGVEVIVYGDANALLTMTHAEGAAQLHLVTEVVLGNEALKLRYDLTGALNVAGAADANGNFHHDCIPL